MSPLLEGRDAHYQRRDWDGDEFGTLLGEWRTVSWHPLIVIEGDGGCKTEEKALQYQPPAGGEPPVATTAR